MELLRCPCATHSEIEYKERRQVVLCRTCTAIFPVTDNIPEMLLSEARPPRGQTHITTGDGTVIGDS